MNTKNTAVEIDLTAQDKSRTHELKTDPAVFAAVLAGEKTHEIRFNDRGFSVGDELLLRETVHSGAEMQLGSPLVYTGRETTRTVSHIQTGYGMADGWCILSFAGTAAPAGQQAEPVAALTDKGRAVIWNPIYAKESVFSGYRPLCFCDCIAPVSAAPAAAAQPSEQDAMQQCGWLYIDDDGHGPHFTDREKYAGRYLHAWPIFKKAPADGHVCDYKLAYGCCSQCEDLAAATPEQSDTTKEKA